YDLEHLGISFKLRGELRTLSLLDFGWRVGLYSQDLARENSTKSGLHKAVTMKAEHLLMEFWPTIRDEEFVVGGTSVKKILTGELMDALSVEPRVKEDDEVEEATAEGAGGSFDVYQNMSRDDWQVHQGQ
ncbi:hypothetical protein Tco_1529060, partial [Tanacetum coccineum]